MRGRRGGGGAGGRGLREKPIALTSVRAVAMNLGAARREQSLVNGSPTRCIAAHSCDAKCWIHRHYVSLSSYWMPLLYLVFYFKGLYFLSFLG